METPHGRKQGMTRIAALTVLGLTLAATTAALAFGAGSQATKHPKLVGTVGKNNAYKISLVTSTGKTAKTLKAGTYTLVIHDDSSLHNYELDGPHGKSWTFTSVPFKGTKTVTLKLAAGAYKAYCEPHESVMFQRFTVK
jgi:plastocyanin